uniref:histidine kinase n=1 Tax=Chromera velia CCMP2878 TaxID=1169474 RepID=A0A0G4I1Q5_9ALVE|eukprot:Cvel_10198.t1-p1 / transcript=Cvel_10198.t1 / gene=Cvel_10198 / organism=Chromera_velia_CCMP2878 / gene_product=hypothetical protein / transcript_product=hypothetical protein / location=Cvel_scaffold610:10581-16046(-) / protein_length=1161 / sequence_SO=supercontig / SO=protein_coding / is_pseudo=false
MGPPPETMWDPLKVVCAVLWEGPESAEFREFRRTQLLRQLEIFPTVYWTMTVYCVSFVAFLFAAGYIGFFGWVCLNLCFVLHGSFHWVTPTRAKLFLRFLKLNEEILDVDNTVFVLLLLGTLTMGVGCIQLALRAHPVYCSIVLAQGFWRVQGLLMSLDMAARHWSLQQGFALVGFLSLLLLSVCIHGNKESQVHLVVLSLWHYIGASVVARHYRLIRWRSVYGGFEASVGKGKAEKRNTDFLGYIMHEVRNPLQGALLVLSSLKASLSTPQPRPRLSSDWGGGRRRRKSFLNRKGFSPLSALTRDADAHRRASAEIRDTAGRMSLPGRSSPSRDSFQTLAANPATAAAPRRKKKKKTDEDVQLSRFGDTAHHAGGGGIACPNFSSPLSFPSSSSSEEGGESSLAEFENSDSVSVSLSESRDGTHSVSVDPERGEESRSSTDFLTAEFRVEETDVNHASFGQWCSQAAVVETQLQHIVAVCTDVLQLEKLESNKFEVEFTTENPLNWFEGVMAVQRETFSAHGVRLLEKVTVQEELRKWALSLGKEIDVVDQNGGDVGIGGGGGGGVVGVAAWLRLGQAAQNFFSNALKFTPQDSGEGEVTASLELSVCDAPAIQTQPPPLRDSSSVQSEGKVTGVVAIGESAGAWSKGKLASTLEHMRGVETALASLVASAPKRGGGGEGQREISESPNETATAESAGGGSGGVSAVGGDGCCRWVRLRLSVSDNGVGIEEKEGKNLFLPYSQIRAGEFQKGGGTGLGLCISKEFLDRHAEGEVGFSSEGKGRGAEFYFALSLPLLVVPPPRSPQTEAETDCRREIESQNTTERETEELAKKAAAPPSFPVSVATGPEAGALQSSPPSSSSEETLKSASAVSSSSSSSGPSLTPPLKIGGTLLPPLPSWACDPRLSPLPVLIVDDSAFCRIGMSALFRGLQIPWAELSDGSEAVEAFRRGERYRLVVMDRNMKDLDGDVATAQIMRIIAEEEDKVAGEKQRESGYREEPMAEEKTFTSGCCPSSSPISLDSSLPFSSLAPATSSSVRPCMEQPHSDRASVSAPVAEKDIMDACSSSSGERAEVQNRGPPSSKQAEAEADVSPPPRSSLSDVRPVIVGLTGDVSVEAVQAFEEAGAFVCLQKPLSAKDLTALLGYFGVLPSVRPSRIGLLS